MGKQLELFEKSKETSKIQQLIELCKHHLDNIDFDAWFSKTAIAHDLCEFEFEGCTWFIIEADSDAFYLQVERGDKVEMSASFYKWKMNDKWGDFDLFSLVAKHIKENRQTYDSIIKNK